MQSPREPNATARKKNGKTYVGSVANLSETYDDKGNSLITFADIQSNSHGDADFMKEFIAARDENSSEEQEITDGAFYLEDIAKEAEKKGLLLIPTALIGKKPPGPLCRFRIFGRRNRNPALSQSCSAHEPEIQSENRQDRCKVQSHRLR